MTAPKSIKVYGARAKLQTAPGTPIVVANTDAILLAKLGVAKRGYAHDGNRAPPPSTMGNQKRVAPSGRFADGVALEFEPRGAAAAYSASVTPNIHTILRACGLDATLTSGAGVEKYVYTPSPGPTGFAIASLDLFGRGEQWGITEFYGDFEVGADGPEVPILKVNGKGLLPTLADAALPDMLATLAAIGAILPPKAINLGFSFNGITSLDPKSWRLKFQRTINPRMSQNGAGHKGFSIGLRNPTLEFEVENVARATIDFDALRDAGTEVAWSFTHGAVQYNRHKLSGSKAQIIDVDDSDEDPTATVKVTCQLNPSAFGQNDEFAWQFD